MEIIFTVIMLGFVLMLLEAPKIWKKSFKLNKETMERTDNLKKQIEELKNAASNLSKEVGRFKG